MADAYGQLLDAVISHLQDMKERGVQFVSVSTDLIRVLKTPAPNIGLKKHGPTPIAPNAPPADSLPTAPFVSPPISSGPKRGASQNPSLKEALFESQSEKNLQPNVQALDLAAKAAAFADLRQRVMVCVKCPHLVASRKNVVFGVGNINSELMFVGEAPGADEDAQAEPFVGRAGQLLTKIIETMGLSRDLVYIANILKCRPDTPGQPTGNRKPTPEEMQTCIPFLHEQIDLIQPKVIVALGGTAVDGLLGKTIGITRLRGTWQSYRNIPLMPTYHPAYLLRNQGPMEKRRVWEDMLQVMEKLGMQISDKQRKFFSKPG